MEKVTIIRFDGALYFGNVSYFKDAILEAAANNPHIKYLLIVANTISEIDASGSQAILDIVDEFKEHDIHLVFSGMNKQSLQTLKRSGVYKNIGEENFIRTLIKAVEEITSRLQVQTDSFLTEEEPKA